MVFFLADDVARQVWPDGKEARQTNNRGLSVQWKPNIFALITDTMPPQNIDPGLAVCQEQSIYLREIAWRSAGK